MHIYNWHPRQKYFHHTWIVNPNGNRTNIHVDLRKPSKEIIHECDKDKFIHGYYLKNVNIYSTYCFILIESISFEILIKNLEYINHIIWQPFDIGEIYKYPKDEDVVDLFKTIKRPCDIFSQEQIKALFLLKEMI